MEYKIKSTKIERLWEFCLSVRLSVCHTPVLCQNNRLSGNQHFTVAYELHFFDVNCNVVIPSKSAKYRRGPKIGIFDQYVDISRKRYSTGI